MELRRVGEAVLRSRLSLAAFLLAPSSSTFSPRIWFPASSIITLQHRSSKGQSGRQISTNQRLHQEAAAAKVSPQEISPEESSLSLSSQSLNDRNLDLGALLSLRAKATTSPKSSAHEVSSRYALSKRASVPVERMLSPSSSLLEIIEEPPVPPREPTIRLSPSTGRSVAVQPGRGVDLARAFRGLQFLCIKNRVPLDFQRQRFHERPGLKRKRLKAQRWKRKFMKGFRGMVTKVQEMKMKGW